MKNKLLKSYYPISIREKALWSATCFSALFLVLVAVLPLSAIGAEQNAFSLRIGTDTRGALLGVRGTLGKHFKIEHSPSISNEREWRSIAGFTMQSDRFELMDPAASGANLGFYRLTELPNPVRLGFAANFRLIDHKDNSHELFYNSDRKAIVLIFVGQETLGSAEVSATLADLTLEFADDNILIWLVNTSPDADRAALAEAADVAALGVPFLHDRAFTVAREYGVTSDLEAVAIDPVTQSIVYRGAIQGSDDKGEDPVPYLEQALRSFLADESVSISMTPSTGTPQVLPTLTPLSYSREVAPIIQAKCVRCHSPGNVGPFSMTNHSVVKEWSEAIKDEVLSGRMPPWHADPRYGEFANDLSLSVTQKAGLLRWIKEGAHRGEGPDPLEELFADAPPTQDYPLAWPPELGEPDYIATIPKQQLPADGVVNYRYETVSVDLPADVWLSAAVVLPGNASVVHHVLVSPGAKYSFQEFFTGYTPGTRFGIYGENTGKHLQGVQQVSFELHYNTTGQPETDETQLGFYFHHTPPSAEVLSAWPMTQKFLIPPGEKEHPPSDAQHTFKEDAWLHTLQPHMHVRGLKMKYEARYPDGSLEVLLNVPKYDFEWQTKYIFANPKFMPSGTRVTVSGAFDNSALNHHNPDPTLSVRWGSQTSGEMFIGFMGYVNSPKPE